jgi:uncharacterized short protein YbdD (DUF466 family)
MVKNKSEKHIMTVTKTDLSSILGRKLIDKDTSKIKLKRKPTTDTTNSKLLELNKLDHCEINYIIQDAVKRVNTTVFHTTHFMKLYLLYLFHNKQEPRPEINEKFIGLCMRTVGSTIKTGRTPFEETLETSRKLDSFYKQHYEPLLGPNPQKTELIHLTQSLKYEEIDILKNIKNNIFMHLADYIKEWVNKTFGLKLKHNDIDKDDSLTKEQKIVAKRNVSIEFRVLKEDLLSPRDTEYISDVKYHDWLNENKPYIITKTVFNKGSKTNNFYYDLKVNPLDYLYSFFHVADKLRSFGRNIEYFPVRSSFIPKYITLDTVAIMNLFCNNITYFLLNVKYYKTIIWSTFFNLDHRAFKKNDYDFYGLIKTDGVGASILFYRDDLDPLILPTDNHKSEELYVDDYVINKMRGIRVVGIDPGKDDLLHCTDGIKFFRYTANQRRLETRKKKYMKINEKQKKYTEDDDGFTIKEWESCLSTENGKTTNFEKLKDFLRIKLPLYTKLEIYYGDPLRRKLRWNTYINTQRSESNMINNFKKKFGKPESVIIGIGDYDQGSYHMKHKEPTKGKGFRKVFRQAGYKVLLVDEYKTSCKCHVCHCDTEKFLWRKNHKPRKKNKPGQKPKIYQETILVHGWPFRASFFYR